MGILLAFSLSLYSYGNMALRQPCDVLNRALETVHSFQGGQPNPFRSTHPAPSFSSMPYPQSTVTREWAIYDQTFQKEVARYLAEDPEKLQGPLRKLFELAGWDPAYPELVPTLSSLVQIYEDRMMDLVAKGVVRAQDVLLPRRRFTEHGRTLWIRPRNPFPMDAIIEPTDFDGFFGALDQGVFSLGEPSQPFNLSNLPSTFHEMVHLAEFYFFPRYMAMVRHQGPEFHRRFPIMETNNAISMAVLETMTLVKPNHAHRVDGILDLPVGPPPRGKTPLAWAEDHLEGLGEKRLKELGLELLEAHSKFMVRRGGLAHDPYSLEEGLKKNGLHFSPVDKWVETIGDSIKYGVVLWSDPEYKSHLAALQLYLREIKDVTPEQWTRESLGPFDSNNLLYRLYCEMGLPVSGLQKGAVCGP